MAQLRALVVGAGAVGQVYGHYLARGGADVTMFVRDKYRAEATAGYDLYHLRTRGVEAERFAGFAVATTMAEVAAAAPALVVVTVDATALDGPWLRELVAATGDATVLALQPGLDAQATYLAAGVRPRGAAGRGPHHAHQLPRAAARRDPVPATGDGLLPAAADQGAPRRAASGRPWSRR
jgi:ketopantoate reductase